MVKYIRYRYPKTRNEMRNVIGNLDRTWKKAKKEEDKRKRSKLIIKIIKDVKAHYNAAHENYLQTLKKIEKLKLYNVKVYIKEKMDKKFHYDNFRIFENWMRARGIPYDRKRIN